VVDPLFERGNNWSPVDYCGTISVRSGGRGDWATAQAFVSVGHSGHPSKWEGSTEGCADFTYCRNVTTPTSTDEVGK
jgi:hypothetical protein